jgi:hypothetical protein
MRKAERPNKRIKLDPNATDESSKDAYMLVYAKKGFQDPPQQLPSLLKRKLEAEDALLDSKLDQMAHS